MNYLNRFPWLKNQYKKFDINNMSQAFLICGPEMSGKNILLKQICADLLLDASTNIDYHQNLIKNNTHPDFFLIDREKVEVSLIRGKNDSKKWDEEFGYRNIHNFISLSPSISKRKVIGIINFDKLNITIQNALLKALEEPDLATNIIMTSSNNSLIRKTVLSRCSKYNISLPETKEISEWISENGYDYNQEDFPNFFTPIQILDELKSKNLSYSNFKEFINLYLLNKTTLSKTIKDINDLQIKNYQKLDYLKYYLKSFLIYDLNIKKSSNDNIDILLKSKFSRLKISNTINEITDLKQRLLRVSSINFNYILNKLLVSAKTSIQN